MKFPKFKIKRKKKGDATTVIELSIQYFVATMGSSLDQALAEEGQVALPICNRLIVDSPRVVILPNELSTPI